MATLGISTNTRLLGMAIINKNGLVDYSIHLHKSSWSPWKANKIVTTLEPCVRRYSIKRIALSMPYEYHQTPQFKSLVSRICEFCQTKNIPFTTIHAETIYTFCQAGQKKTKKEMMLSLVQLYPELQYYYVKEKRNKNKYYIKLFEAVAAATVQHTNE